MTADRPAAPGGSRSGPRSGSRAELIADTALALLVERGMRGLTHRAVDEAAGLPLGSTSNHARTRAALLKAAVRRLAEREARVLTPEEMPPLSGGPDRPSAGGTATGGTAAGGTATGGTAAGGTAASRTAAGGTGTDPIGALADTLALALHRSLTMQRDLLIARYELALEATRRPELREFYDAAGRGFRKPLEAMMASVGSTEPRRHARSLTAWCEGLMFGCAAGADHADVPGRAELRTGFEELLRGMVPISPGGAGNTRSC
ncbi:TetR family transcriptional regulator [Streptomyces sp. NA02950]|uniref:TetR/AcrR family transcriptional regulator n=1 Tax=Streptomyces sp. NA02950 TaxID=2742137 RepID=UPI001592330B|nr:TetR/AcrR family transcriptional regulator [Streptomyces sp. NA02950]QKV91267.1 TetR family transcriptional regulator [Streptomyces sp. NA02950]